MDAAPSCKGPDPPKFEAVQPNSSPRDVGQSSGLQWHICMCPPQLPGSLCNSWYGRHTAEVVACGPPSDPQTRFAFSFVDESSRHSIPVGLDLAAFGAHCMFCGDAGQLRPYSAITLLASQQAEKGGKVTAQQIAWLQSEHFANLNVHLDQGQGMQYGDSQRFATSSVLQFVLYRTRCTACVLTQQFRMDLPLATVVRGLFTGGGSLG